MRAALTAQLGASSPALSFRALQVTNADVEDICKALTSQNMGVLPSSLDFRDNEIGDAGAQCLAQCLAHMVHVRRVDVSGNRITDVGANALLDVLYIAGTLDDLVLEPNPITNAAATRLTDFRVLSDEPLNLRKYIGVLQSNPTKLTEIDLDEHRSERYYSDEAVVILCKHLLHNTAVTSLTVSHNGLTEKCCESLAELLRLNRTLERLDVAHNALAAGGVALAEALKANVGLLHFDLSHCSLDDAAGEALAAAFKGHGTLQGACVGHNDFGEGVCSRLALAFCQNPRLDTLDLSALPLRPEDQRMIDDSSMLAKEPPHLKAAVQLVVKNQPTYKCVDLMFRPGFHERQVEELGMKFLMIALRDNDHVTSLALGGNKLNVPTCRYIQRELRTKPNITELSIVYNQPCLDFRDARDFCGMLQQSPHIRSVDFSRNLMLEEGAQELLNTVTNWPYLTQVKLDENDAEAATLERIALLAQANQHPPGLKAMLLRYLKGEYPGSTWNMGCEDPLNYVEGRMLLYDDAAVEFTCRRVLQDSKQFDTLALGNNAVTVEGLAHVIALFEANSSFTTLDVSGNQVSDKGAEMLIKLLKDRYSVQCVLVDGNPMSQSMKEEIQRVVVFNSTTQELKDLLVMVEADEEENTELQAADLRSPLRDSDVEILLASFGKGNRHITSLNLSNNYLTARGAMAVMRFVQNSPQVTALRLNNNGIEGGEGVARGLKMLLLGSETIQHLSLDNNDLGDDDVQALIEGLKPNGSLTSCSVQGNLRVSPSVSHRLDQSLTLNRHPKFKPFIPRLSADDDILRTLEFAGLQLDDLCIEILVEALSTNSTVTAIRLNNNQVQDGGVGLLCNVLDAKHCRLQHLDLSHNGVTVRGVRMLSDVLLRNTSLASLNLMHNRIGDAALKPLQEMLDRNDTLMDLLVDGNPMRNDVILKVYSTSTNTQQKLKQDLRRLQAWDAELTAVDFSGQASSKSAANDLTCKLLAEALSSSHVVTSVNLNYSNVSDLGLGMLTDMLYSNTYIHTLMLDGCCITDAGVKLLAAMLLKNSTLSYISLRHNAITDDGCMALQRALVHNYTVKRLSVDHNPEVSERSFMTLGYSITLNNEPILLKQVIPQVHSNSLTVLDCSRKGVDDTLPFTDSSITLLCSVLAHSRSLTHINLKRNRIGAYGGTCLADVMLSNRTITALDLLGNEVGSGVTAFVDLLRRSSDVQHLDLRENGIEAALMSSVSLLLELNHHPPMVKHMMLQLLDGEKPDKVELTGTANGCTAIGKAQPSASEPWGGSTTTMLTSRSVGLLCDELYVNTSLTSFDFSHNYVGDAGAERVAQLVHAFPNSYVNINLAGNCIQDSGAIKLINAVMHAPAVTYFNLSDNLLKDASAYSLLHLLDKRYDLEHIHFEDNRLISPHHQKMLDVHGRLHQVHTDMRATLKQIIENGDDVRTLNMNDPDTGRLWDRQQQADDTLLEFVFSVMAEFRSHINESDFAGTRVRDQHMPTLSRILSDPDICPLSILNLADNDITDVTDMFRALKHNKCLKRLDLSRNRIPRCNGFPIVDALKGNRILDVLTLTGNPVSLSVPAYGSWGGIHRNIRDDPIWEQVYRHLTKPLGFQWYKEIHKVERWERSK